MSEFASISSSPRRVRQSNAVAALQALFRCGRLSRADLARQLGLNRSSSGHIVAELTGSGLVREVAEDRPSSPSPARAGRPGILLELVPDAAFFLGAEIGVEHITTLRIDLNADTAACRVVPFDGRSVPAAEAVGQAVRLSFGDLPPGGLDRCEGFGLAAPAQMDPQGRVRIAPILGWRDIDLAALTREALPAELPVAVENDANAFAIGESYRRRGGRAGVTLFLVLESGVGGGIVIDGRLFRGGHGLAGEIGHMRPPGAEGQELEQLLGLERLLARHREATGDPEATLRDLLADLRDGAPPAVALAEEWAEHLAFAIVQACRVVDPDRIVLGGSVAALFPLVADRVEARIRAGQAPTFPLPEIVLHDAPETGAAFGAACMLHQRFLSRENESLVDEAPRARGLPEGAGWPEGPTEEENGDGR